MPLQHHLIARFPESPEWLIYDLIFIYSPNPSTIAYQTYIKMRCWSTPSPCHHLFPTLNRYCTVCGLLWAQSLEHLLVLAPAMETLGEPLVFLVLHGQQKFARTLWLLNTDVLDVNLETYHTLIYRSILNIHHRVC